jgi:cellulose synthase operon protein C
MRRFLRRYASRPHTYFVPLLALPLVSCGSPQQRAQGYYEDGVKLLAQHDDQKAAIQFKNAVQLDRHLLPAWRGLAQAEELDHHWQALASVLRTILELDPQDEAARLKLAKLLLMAGAAEQSLKVINEASESGVKDAGLLALRAVILYKLKDHDAAIRAANAALKLEPNSEGALVVLAADRLANNDPQGALQLLSSGPLASTADVGVQLIKLEAYEKLTDWPHVESILVGLTKRYPKEAAFRRQLIKFYIDQHRLGDAESELRAIAAVDQNDSEAELDLIRFLYSFKGAAVGRKELVARINAGGNVFPYQMALSEFDYAAGDFADSRKLLETLAGDASSPAHALAAKIKLAEMYLTSKDLDAAGSIVSKILQDDSSNVNALKIRALIRMERGQVEPAISDLLKALDAQPTSTELMMLLATAYERVGSIELAENEYADALRASNFNAGVGLSYAAFLQRHGSMIRAQAVLTDLASREPKNVTVLSALGEIALTQQDWAGAEAISVSIRRIGGNDAVAYQILGASLSGQQKYDASIAAFKNAVAAAPTEVQSMVSLVRTFMLAKESDKAEAFLQNTLKTNPENAEVYVLLGSIQLASNKPDQAAKNFAMAIEKQPNDSTGYCALADFYLRQKNTDAAIQTIRAGLKQRPASVMLHMALAAIFEQIQNYEAAILQYEYVLTQQPGSTIATNNLASLLSDHRSDRASLERAETLGESLQQSQVPQYKDTLGWVDYRRGDFTAAVPLLEEAAAALPKVALIHYHLGMSYLAMGQAGDALNQFKIALVSTPDSDLAEKIKSELNKATKN